MAGLDGVTLPQAFRNRSASLAALLGQLMFGPDGTAGYGVKLTPGNVEVRLAALCDRDCAPALQHGCCVSRIPHPAPACARARGFRPSAMVTS